jgi:hypothetical protein
LFEIGDALRQRLAAQMGGCLPGIQMGQERRRPAVI